MKMIWKLILTVLSFVVVLVVSLCVGEIDDMLSKLFSVGGETLTETDILIYEETLRRGYYGQFLRRNTGPADVR